MHYRKTFYVFALGVASALSTGAAVASSTGSFMRKAAQSDRFEIMEGRLAQKLGSPRVRHFGAEMVRDHTMTTSALHAAIRSAGMAVPPPPPLSAKQRQMYSILAAHRGAAFDKVYQLQAVASHREALAAMKKYAATGSTRPIARAASKAVPIVTSHLMMAKHLNSGRM